MTFSADFIDIQLENLHHEAAVLKSDGWRFIQTHAVNTDDGIDLYYSFMKDLRIVNYKVSGVKKDQPVPSITDLFLAAFVFENEARELFGVDMRNIVIDFAGAMYTLAEEEPMTFISPEQKAMREKARLAAQKVEDKQDGEGRSEAAPVKRIFIMTPERQARLDAKMATMSEEKKAKVEAALKARAQEAAAAAGSQPEAQKEQAETKGVDVTSDTAVASKPEVDEALEAKLAALPADKASKVRAALGMDEESSEPKQEAKAPAQRAAAPEDSVLASKIAIMDPDKAERVRAALSASGDSAEVN